jgi:hypothetical protein
MKRIKKWRRIEMMNRITIFDAITAFIGVIIGIIVGVSLKAWYWGIVFTVFYELLLYMLITWRIIENRWKWDIQYKGITPKMKELRELINNDNYTRAQDLIEHLIKHLKYEPFSPEKADTLRKCYKLAQKSILAVATYEPNWWFMPQSSFYLGNHMLISLKHYIKQIVHSKATSNPIPNWINPFPFSTAIDYLKNGNLIGRELITARFFIYPNTILERFNREPIKEEIDFFFAMHKFAQIAPIVIEKDLVLKWLDENTLKAELDMSLIEMKKQSDKLHQEIYDQLKKEKLQDFALIDRDIVIHFFEKEEKDICKIYVTNSISAELTGCDIIVSDSIVKYFIILMQYLLEGEKNNKKHYIFPYQILSKNDVIDSMVEYYKNNF